MRKNFWSPQSNCRFPRWETFTAYQRPENVLEVCWHATWVSGAFVAWVFLFLRRNVILFGVICEGAECRLFPWDHRVHFPHSFKMFTAIEKCPHLQITKDFEQINSGKVSPSDEKWLPRHERVRLTLKLNTPCLVNIGNWKTCAWGCEYSTVGSLQGLPQIYPCRRGARQEVETNTKDIGNCIEKSPRKLPQRTVFLNYCTFNEVCTNPPPPPPPLG